MTTLDDALHIQKTQNILQAPTVGNAPMKGPLVELTSATLPIQLKNNTTSSNVYVYVTGLDINRSNAIFLLQSDGKSGYWPTSPGADQSALAANCGILLGAPGTTRTITIPQLAGGRIYMCIGNTITFLLNKGPALVEPSTTNPSDPNYYNKWDFCEFTYDTAQMFANITYVDFVSVPIGLSLVSNSGTTQTVTGMTTSALDTICAGLQAQDNSDKAGWSKLIIKGKDGSNLRALSCVGGIIMNPGLFGSYYTSYISSTWNKYASSTLTIDTQNTWGVLSGKTTNGNLVVGGISFSQPSAYDVFTGASGPFSKVSEEQANIAARLSAALNRGTLLNNANQPDGENPSNYYTSSPCNHYSRIVHANNANGRGYAFPFDDVVPTGGTDVAGTVADGNPKLMTVIIGGPTASTKMRMRETARSGGHASQQVGGGRAYRITRRGLDWSSADDEKAALAEQEMVESEHHGVHFVDLEMGQQQQEQQQLVSSKLEAELARIQPRGFDYGAQQQALMARPLSSLVPAALQTRLDAFLDRIERSPAYAYAKPAVDVLLKLVVAVLSLSVRSLVSRVAMVIILVSLSFMLGFFGRGVNEAAEPAMNLLLEQTGGEQ